MVHDDDDRDHDDDDHRYIYDHGRVHDRGHMVHDRHLTHSGGDVYSFCIFSYVYDHIHGDDDRNRGYYCNQHYYRNRHLNRTGYWVVSNEHLFLLHLHCHLLKDHVKRVSNLEKMKKLNIFISICQISQLQNLNQIEYKTYGLFGCSFL